MSSGSPFLKIEVSEDAVQKVEEVSHENQDKENQAVPAKKDKIEFEQSSNVEIQIKPPITSNVNNENIYAGPAVRKLAREFGIDLSIVLPTGPKNRIQKEDLHHFVKSRLSSTPQVNSFQFTQPDIDLSLIHI